MATLHIQVNRQQLAETERLLKDVKGGFGRVVVRALKRSVQTGRTDISRAVRAEITLKKSQVDPRIKTDVRSAGVGSIGTITISRQPVPLVQFIRNPGVPTSRPKYGVRVKVRKSKGSELLKGTFMHISSRGKLNINERIRAGAKRVPRLPIQPRYGPTVHGVFEKNPLGNKAVRDLSVVFHKRLDHETRFEIAKAAARNKAKP